MAESSFPIAQAHVLAYEGGYSNDKDDAGGVTLNGIIQSVYDSWRAAHGKAKRTLTRAMNGTAEWNAERDAIYRERYWLPLRAPELPSGVDGASYDYGVNSGIGRSAKVLQRLVGVADDGRIGEVTLDAVAKRDPEDLAHRICEERQAFLNHLAQSKPSQQKFLNGWLKRVRSVDGYTKALAVAAKAKAPVPAPAPQVTDVTGKAHVPESAATKAGKVVAKTAGPGAIVEEGARAGSSWLDWIAAHPLETALGALAFCAAVIIIIHIINVRHQRRQEAPVPGFDYTPVPPAT